MERKVNFLCRVPPDIKAFLEAQAAHYGSSLSVEVIRCVREKMEKVPSAKLVGVPFKSEI